MAIDGRSDKSPTTMKDDGLSAIDELLRELDAPVQLLLLIINHCYLIHFFVEEASTRGEKASGEEGDSS